MKRFITALFAITLCVVSFAGNPVKIVTGKANAKGIMADNATAAIKFDWSKTTYDGKQSISDYFGDDCNFIVTDCQSKFVESFNEASKGLKLTDKEESAKYIFTLTVSKVDCFFAAMGFVPGHESKMWGKLTVCSAETGDTLLEADIDEAEDGRDFVRNESFGKTFGILGKRIAKLK